MAKSSQVSRTENQGLCTQGPAPGITRLLDCSDPTRTLLLSLCIGVTQRSPRFSLPTMRSLGPLYQVDVCTRLGSVLRVCTKGRKLERLAAIPPDELSRMGIQGPALVQEEVP